MLSVVDKIIRKSNYKFDYIDLGGGMGIQYNKEKKLNYKVYKKGIDILLKKNKSKIIFEPGRSIIGNAGLLITKVIYKKQTRNKDFIILDSGMNDFMRPALYGARHRIIPAVRFSKKSKKIYEFDGPICETTDRYLTLKNYQKIYENDIVIICDVGAYGMSLSSNYNLRPKPTELLINGTKKKLLRKTKA